MLCYSSLPVLPTYRPVLIHRKINRLKVDCFDIRCLSALQEQRVPRCMRIHVKCSKFEPFNTCILAVTINSLVNTLPEDGRKMHEWHMFVNCYIYIFSIVQGFH